MSIKQRENLATALNDDNDPLNALRLTVDDRLANYIRAMPREMKARLRELIEERINAAVEEASKTPPAAPADIDGE